MRQTPEESAHLAGFLVSDEAGWITGQTTHRAIGRCEDILCLPSEPQHNYLCRSFVQPHTH